ncbi:hypothetical protein NHX12_032709 [Muraenolepis orangiensis]|uniref:Uncharacterized protein n=1 Tax=Muraenolepis orangiensis TaxID=630683 RepID=A0A9Q0EC46_9TELE|nr:hypothetical protein NHX12_032709 [Muraenolepis orangiensis]
MTEILKRQSTKSKMGYNQQLCVSEVRVDRVRVRGEDGTTCDVSLCCKPGSSSDWRSHRPLPGRVRPLHPAYCSLLCLPINSFTASNH